MKTNEYKTIHADEYNRGIESTYLLRRQPLTASIKLQHRGKIMTSYAPLASDRRKAIAEQFAGIEGVKPEQMLSQLKAEAQQHLRTGYAEAHRQRNSK